MRINVCASHKAVNIRIGVSVTNTNLRIISYKLLGTECDTCRICVKTFGFGCIVQLGFVKHSLNPYGCTFKNVIAGSHAFTTG